MIAFRLVVVVLGAAGRMPSRASVDRTPLEAIEGCGCCCRIGGGWSRRRGEEEDAVVVERRCGGG